MGGWLEVHMADVGNLNSPICFMKEEFCAEENQQTSMRDVLDKFKPSQHRLDEGTTFEMLTSFKEGESKNIFGIGDLVWGKVRSHPWWPGQIYDESLIPSPLCDAMRDGSVLVAFYGDNSYAWLEPDEIIPFEPHFEEKSKKSKLQTFIGAVEEAIDELKRRAALGLTCFCQSNLQLTTSEGLYKVDVTGYEPGPIYSSKQIKKSRDSFQPHGMFSFVKKLAKSPTSLQDVYGIIKSAKVTAYRKVIFEENDETYDQAFDEFEKGDETYDQAFGAKASSLEDPVEFSKDRNQFTDGEKLFEDQGDCSKYSCRGETKRKRREESPPDNQSHKGKIQKDAFFDHLVTKSGEGTDGICYSKNDKPNKLNDCGAELGNTTVVFKHMKQFQSTFYQESYSPDEDEKTNESWTLLKCQDEHMTGKKELRGLKSSHYGDQKLLTSQEGDDVDIQSTLSVQSEKKFTEESEVKAELMLVEEEAILKGNADTNSIVCDYPEVDVKVNTGLENCQVVLTEILGPVSSSIQYKHKVCILDETDVAINEKYSMDEGWKSHYQQNLSSINSSDLSLQLANLFQKCNEILGGIEESQDPSATNSNE
ncbi:unnamed protein product [Withania somnifera]